MDKILLWKNGAESSITPFLLNDGKMHPGMLVIPGGGYGTVCESTEGSPIARRFNELGYHAFVLDYRVAPHRFPEPQLDAFRAMKIIRGNAGKWNIIPDRIAAVGFSAGGHLCACLGTLSEEIDPRAGDEFDSVDPIPDGMILSYAVVSFLPENSGHIGSGKNLLAERLSELEKTYSLEFHVTQKTPPAFIWCTFGDQIVSYKNSIVFAQAMKKAGRPCELHIFAMGDHGMLLGLDTEDVVGWTAQADAFLKTQWAYRADPEAIRKKYTNPYQAAMEKQIKPESFPGHR